MSRRYRVALAAIITVAAFSGVAPTFAGIPVTVVANVPETGFHLQKIAKFVEQINQMKAQLTELKRTYDSLTGITDLGDAFNNPYLKDFYPSDLASVYNAVENGGYDNISGAIEDIVDTEHSRVNDGTVDEAWRDLKERMMKKAAADKAMGKSGYEASKERLENIEGLMGKINTLSDPKEIMDLQARIQAEQAAIENENTKIMLMRMAQKAEEDLVREQMRGLALREFDSKATEIPSIEE